MTSHAPSPDRRRRVRLLLVASCSALAVLFSWFAICHWLSSGASVATDNAYTRGEITTVAPQVAGYVSEVLVDDNQAVKRGQVLFRIDESDYRARMSEAAAGVERQVRGLARIDREIGLQGAVIAQVAADVEAAKVEARRTALDARRYKALVERSLVSRQAYDAAETARLKAVAATEAAAARQRAEASRREVLKAQRLELDSALEQVRAAQRLASNALRHTVITAPIDGVVANRQIRVGRYVSPGAPALSLVPLRDVWVVANFKETQLTDVRIGDRATVKVDMYPDVGIAGTVESIAPGSGAQFALIPPDNATGNFTKIPQRVPVKIVLDSGHPLAGKLYAGLSAEVTIALRKQGGTDEGSSGLARVQED
ncbi:HlyD family secretion protein [Luteimonas mephitis]|uniref:HlyD family secretion protein n=1 Tax=Luteimonas mephitis TaxID=83615 RepID=UPI00047E1F9F|nr:HlyD family secretion protein [Luteimonas mephitis]